MGWLANLKEKFKTDPEFRGTVLKVAVVTVAAGALYGYGRKHGFAKAERKLEQTLMLEEHDET